MDPATWGPNPSPMGLAAPTCRELPMCTSRAHAPTFPRAGDYCLTQAHAWPSFVSENHLISLTWLDSCELLLSLGMFGRSSIIQLLTGY
jgi:hypothetical protein